MSMWHVTISAMKRRKRWTALLLCIALLEACAAMVLCMLTERQEAALDKTVNETVISCVVTRTNGTRQDDLHMLSSSVDLLLGRRHDEGYYQDEYIKNVRAVAKVNLFSPSDFTMFCIMSPDSAPAFTEVEGGKMTLFEGWDESVFMSDQEVCVIPVGYPCEEDYLEIRTADFTKRLKIIGTHTGPGNGFYCPFYTMRVNDGITTTLFVDSCSFEIRETRLLEEARKSLYEVFVKPDINNAPSAMTFGLRIEDGIFQRTMAEIRGNIRTLQILLPALLLIGGAVGFFAAYLSTQSRLREYAVMRCLGMTRGKIFMAAFEEHLVLALAGAALGIILGIVINSTLTLRMLLYCIGGIAAFLIGTALSVSRVTRINVMKLMKTEE